MLGTGITFQHDGVSVWSGLQDPSEPLDRPYLYWEHYISWEKQFSQAVRQDEWKALRIGETGQPERIELYNLETDIGEKNNLAEQFPERTNEMIRMMEAASIKPENDTFIYYKDFYTN
jgi:hypothetical protein